MRLTGYVSAILLILILMLGSSFVMAVDVGVQPGHWAKYTASVFGQEFTLLTISISSVSGTTVSLNMTYEYPTGGKQTQQFQGDVSKGDLWQYIIPANLGKGDVIYQNYYDVLRVENVTTRSYAGASRTVVSANRYGYTYYWDQQTGILVEMTWGTGMVTSSLKLTETNIWVGGFFDVSNPFFWVLIIVIIVVVVILLAVILRILRKGRPPRMEVAAPPPTSSSTPPPATPPSAPKRKFEQTKYCTKCGANIALDATFCIKCGHKQPQT